MNLFIFNSFTREREREMQEEVAEIPVVEISAEALEKKVEGDEDGEGWKHLCRKVREACESDGLFIIKCEEMVSGRLQGGMFAAMEALFDLPEETKKKYQVPNKPYRSYQGKCPIVPLSESFGIDEASSLEVSQAFTHLMWPLGNPHFCEVLNSMSSKMEELNFTILRMILESFGMEKHCDDLVKDSTTFVRMMKYRVPPAGDAAVGLVAHTDKNALTILCQNEVQGLEFITKQGNWAQVVVPQNCLVAIVGDALKAWSNGRFVAPKHRVMMKAKKERYSFGVFSMPTEGATIQVPHELVDNEHPLIYRPFKFADFISYFISNLSDDALEIYAGV